MDSSVDKAVDAAKKTDELVDERTRDEGGGSEVRGRAFYGVGVPTAESYVDDMPLEWSRDEDGAGPRDPT